MKRVVCSAFVVALLEAGALATVVCGQTPVRVVSQTPPRPLQTTKDGQSVDAERQTARVALRLPNGKDAAAYVFMVREPQSGLHWWSYQGAETSALTATDDPAMEFVVAFAGDKAVGFAFATPFLGIREVQGRRNDFAAIQQAAAAEIERNLRAIQDGSMTWVREITLAGKLDREFMHLAGSAAPVEPKVTAVTRANGRWEVTLQGPNRDTAVVTLDDQYEVVSVRRQPAARQ
jgi:hypothetical protein